MYLPRSLISHLYLNLVKTHHALSPPVLILVALDPDSLCACRIFTQLLKRDYIPHKIKPITGYGDLARAGQDLVRPMRIAEGGSGGVVCCLGVGGLVDVESVLGLEANDDGTGGLDGVDVWVLDSRRPWNLANVFGGSPLAQDVEPTRRVAALKELGIDKGAVSRSFRSGKGGVIVFDDGDIHEELDSEREAWYALEEMPDIDDDDGISVTSSTHDRDETQDDVQVPSSPHSSPSRKRKSISDNDESDDEEERPRRRRRSNSSSSIAASTSDPIRRRLFANADGLPPSNQHFSIPTTPEPEEAPAPTERQLLRRLLRLRKKHDATLRRYHTQGTSYSEPISSLMYSLASELGREDNDLLWLGIVGVSSMELYGRTATGFSLTNHDVPASPTGWTGRRGARIRQLLRDEVRRLNPPELTESGREVLRGQATDAIPVHARSPTDTGIKLSPEPRFLLLRHWSLYDSMLHSPYLAAKLHLWTDNGRRRLHKLLAKMGVSLAQCKQSYTHMDMDLKRGLRERLLHFAPMYGLDALVPPATSAAAGSDKDAWGFVRAWGWKACLSAADVAVVVGAVLELGPASPSASISHLPSPPNSSPSSGSGPASLVADDESETEAALKRFYAAYDALLSPTRLAAAIPTAQTLHRAILRTGSALLQKRHLRHLRAFRLGVLKDGPDVNLFCRAGALAKLALWVGAATAEMEQDRAGKKPGGTPLVLACLDDARGVFVVVGVGGGSGGVVDAEEVRVRKEKREAREKRKKEREERREKRRREREEREDDDEEEGDEDTEDSGSESEADEEGKTSDARNRFGNAFQEVVEESGARVKLDSFEHCVVEVRKEDLSGFLEGLSMKAVVG